MPIKNKDEYNSYMNEYMKKQWENRRKKAVDFLGGICVWCSDIEELEFDHIDPESKYLTIAQLSSSSEVIFWEEVQKCQLLCKPCHIEKHR